jgi:hypothetical protein
VQVLAVGDAVVLIEELGPVVMLLVVDDGIVVGIVVDCVVDAVVKDVTVVDTLEIEELVLVRGLQLEGGALLDQCGGPCGRFGGGRGG